MGSPRLAETNDIQASRPIRNHGQSVDAIIPADDTRSQATLQAWLLAVLRFAITLKPGDRLTALAAAAELDRSGETARATEFRYFTRLSIRLCAAVAAPDEPASAAVFRDHVARITEPRLQRAFAAALDLKLTKTRRAGKCPPKPINLWKGLGR
ncbi:MAG: hypothetical protein JWQ24_3054 [Tardiphaga sp.]|nr:hypothetical protein [Tardiphaga sp.]